MDFLYKLVPRLFTPSINPGDPIELSIFFSGTNNDPSHVIRGKLYFNYFSKYLIDSKKPGNVKANIDSIPDQNDPNLHFPVFAPEKVTETDLSPWGFILTVSSIFFVPNPDSTSPGIGKPIFAEAVVGKDAVPPIECKINTSSKTPPGNYDIDLVLTYTDDNIIKSDSAKLTIHVRSWVERNGKLLQIIGGIVAIIGIIIGVVALSS